MSINLVKILNLKFKIFRFKISIIIIIMSVNPSPSTNQLLISTNISNISTNKNALDVEREFFYDTAAAAQLARSTNKANISLNKENINSLGQIVSTNKDSISTNYSKLSNNLDILFSQDSSNYNQVSTQLWGVDGLVNTNQNNISANQSTNQYQSKTNLGISTSISTIRQIADSAATSAALSAIKQIADKNKKDIEDNWEMTLTKDWEKYTFNHYTANTAAQLTSLGSRITLNDNNIAVLQDKATNFNADIETNITNISENTQLIANTSTNVSSSEVQLLKNTSDLNVAQTAIGLIEAKQASNPQISSNVSSNTSEIYSISTTQSINQSTNDYNINELAKTEVSNYNNISTNTDNIDGIFGTLKTYTQQISVNTRFISSNYISISSNKDYSNKISTTQYTHQVQNDTVDAALEQRVSTIEKKLKDDVVLQTKIDTDFQLEINKIKRCVSTLEETIKFQANSISQILNQNERQNTALIDLLHPNN